MPIYRRDARNKPRWKDIYERAPHVPSISKGEMTMKVPITIFSENRKRLVQLLREVTPNAIVIIQTASAADCRGSSSYVQDSNFFWAFGYQKSGAMGAIDVVNNKSYLIVPRLRNKGLEWCEERWTRGQTKEHFLVNGVWYLDELECFLDFVKYYNDCKLVLILDYQKRELPACIFHQYVDDHTLGPAMHKVTTKKTESEIKILCYIAKNLEGALIYIMKRFRPGMTNTQLEAWFSFFMTYKGGLEQLSFSIFSGSDLVDFDSKKRRLPTSRQQRVFKEGELCIIEVGAAYFGYWLSLGAVLPVNEEFNRIQKTAYELMLRVRITVSRELRSGVPLRHIHTVAEKCLINSLIDSKLLYGTVDGAFDHGVGKLLIPRSLVHSLDIGCDEPDRLELGRTYLVKTGCFFTKRSMDEAFNNEILKRYLSPDLRQYEGIVVKVSDPVLITINGFKFLSDMPRATCTINDLRLIDQTKRRDFTSEVEKENMTVRPSLFDI